MRALAALLPLAALALAAPARALLVESEPRRRLQRGRTGSDPGARPVAAPRSRPTPATASPAIPQPSRWAGSCSRTRRLSGDGERSCATCHDPARFFADGRDRSIGLARVDRNAIAPRQPAAQPLVRLGRAPPTACGRRASARSSTTRSSAAAAELLRERAGRRPGTRSGLRSVFGSVQRRIRPRLVLVNVAKALAALPGDHHHGPHCRSTTSAMRSRAATARPWPAIRAAAQRGPARSSSARAGAPPVITGRTSPTASSTTWACPTSPSRAAWTWAATAALPRCGQARSICSGVTTTIPRQGHGSADTARRAAAPQLGRVPRALAAQRRRDRALHAQRQPGHARRDVVRHYSEVDVERLHGDDGARLVRPLRLSAREVADLVAFLETLSAKDFYGQCGIEQPKISAARRPLIGVARLHSQLSA